MYNVELAGQLMKAKSQRLLHERLTMHHSCQRQWKPCFGQAVERAITSRTLVDTGAVLNRANISGGCAKHLNSTLRRTTQEYKSSNCIASQRLTATQSKRRQHTTELRGLHSSGHEITTARDATLICSAISQKGWEGGHQVAKKSMMRGRSRSEIATSSSSPVVAATAVTGSLLMPLLICQGKVRVAQQPVGPRS